MLTDAPTPFRNRSPRRARGIVLFMTLIVLVIMALGTLALMRATDTTTQIAGNLSFHQSTVHSGDAGSETAINWLMANGSGTKLFNDSLSNGYLARWQDPAYNTVTGDIETWDSFWKNTLGSNKKNVVRLPADASGNVVSYVIQRMCLLTGDPNLPATQCTGLTSGSAQDSSHQAGSIGLQGSLQVYYRITSRIEGSKNTVSYIQTFVLL